MKASRIYTAVLVAGLGFGAAQASDDPAAPADAPDSQAPATLEAVKVSADPEPAARYLAPDARSGTKSDAPLLETPMAISVLTQDLLRDRGAQSLQDALRYSAGVMSDAYGLDNRTDSAIIRGTEFQQVLDGMRETFTYYNIARPDPWALERIEIVRGPASVLYGQGPVAGVVNLVSKTPQSTAAREIVGEYGSFDRRQLAVDLTGPLSADGQWLYRLVGLYRESGTQVDHASDDRQLLSPSLSWRPNDALQWTLLGTVQRDETGQTISFLPHSGTALPNPNGQIPVSRFTSEPGFDRFDVDKEAISSMLSWQLSPVWSLHQNARYAKNDNPYRALYPDVFSNPQAPFLDPEQRSVARYVYMRLRKAEDFTADTQARAVFSVGALTHELLAGIDIGRSKLSERNGYGYNATPFDLYAPEYGLDFEIPELGPAAHTKMNFDGVYLQDQIKIAERFIVVGGLRHDWAKTDPDGAGSRRDEATSGRAGLLWLARHGISPYLSYSTSFLPNSDVDPDTEQIYDPVRGKQFEAGIKFQPRADTLITASWYDLDEKNRVAYGVLGVSGLTRVDAKGLELEATTRLGALDVVASYTYNDHAPREYTATQPEHQASLWSKYRWHGLEFGGGIRYLGSTSDETGAIGIDAVTLIDALAAYHWRQWRLAINATNLGDEVYVASCLVRGDCFYGNRRVVVGSVAYRF